MVAGLLFAADGAEGARRGLAAVGAGLLIIRGRSGGRVHTVLCGAGAKSVQKYYLLW